MNQKEKAALQEAGNRLVSQVRNAVSLYLLTENIDALERLTRQIDILMGYEVLKSLQDKGMDEEITKLVEKAGLKKR